MEPVNGMDASMLYMETDRQPMNTAVVLELDPTTIPGGYSFEALRAQFLGRASRVDFLHRRIREVPFGLAHPAWSNDAAFDRDHHVRRVLLTEPRGLEALCAIGAEMMGERFDRTKPLWRMVVVEGMRDGRVGVVIAAHHVTLDGVSGTRLMDIQFDLEPVVDASGGDTASPAIGAARAPVPITRRALLVWALRRRARQALLAPGTARRAVQAVRARRAAGADQPSGLDGKVPRLPWNRPITSRRSWVTATVPLDDVKRVGKAFGVTVNDVAVSLVASALRAHLQATDALPEESLVSVCPVSVHDGSLGDGQAGNQWSAMRVSLGTHLDDPVDRLRWVHERTTWAKARQRVGEHRLLLRLAEHASPNLMRGLYWLNSRAGLARALPPMRNAVISNVPGPPVPLYFGGARIVEMHVTAPIMEGCGLLVSVFSYCGTLNLGFHVCADLIPDAAVLVAPIRGALDELMAAGEPRVAEAVLA